MRTLGVGLDFLPELANVDPKILRIGVVAPQLAEQELVRQDFAGMLHEEAQKVVFLR